MAYPKVTVDGREYAPKLAPAINKDQTLAQYLVVLREDSGLTTADVEEMVGLKRFYVESWEKNASQMPFSHAALLARVYGVSLDLFGLRVMRAVEEAEDGRPLATHLDYDGSAQRAGPDPLRKPVDYGGIVSLTPKDEVDEVDDEEAPRVELNSSGDQLDLDVDDSDEYVDDEPPAVFDSEPETYEEPPAAPKLSRLQSVMDELL